MMYVWLRQINSIAALQHQWFPGQHELYYVICVNNATFSRDCTSGEALTAMHVVKS